MKNLVKFISASFIMLLVFSACNREQTIQEYYVESQENSNFLAIDIPASMVNLGENASAETKETLASIKKLNVLAFKINDSNQSEFQAEYQKVKKILKNDRYNELMRMKHEGVNIVINFEGSDEAVDEFILFAADQSKGFALARVLGDKMEPQKMIKMAGDMKNIDQNTAGFQQLTELFGEFTDK